MNNVKLIIFDLDGTTAHTLPGITEAVNRTMREYGYPLYDDEGVRRFVNFGVRQFTEEMLPESVRGDDSEVLRVMDTYLRHYGETYPLTEHFPGIPELLERLSARTLVAMNSNKQDEYVKVLNDKMFRPGLFFCAEGFRLERPGKPDPAMALYIKSLAEEKLGCPLSLDECVYIGDSDIDFYTARNAGMRLVSVSWGYRSYDFLRALGDQPVARTPDELWEILVDMGL